MIRIVEPGTEGSHVVVYMNGPLKNMLCGYDKINEWYIGDVNPYIWYGILDTNKVNADNMIEVVEKPDSSGKEVQFDCYYRDGKTGVKTDKINHTIIGMVADAYFAWELAVKPTDEILKSYGTHVLRRADISADGKFSPPNDDDLIPIWKIAPNTRFFDYGWHKAGWDKGEELKEEYERQMALKNQP